jgi:hypothetical protein
MILDALGQPEASPAVHLLAEAFGGDPGVSDRRIGEPVHRSRALSFASGAEILLDDDAVSAVVLDLTLTPVAPRGIDLSTWIPTVTNRATLDDLARAIGSKPRFAGIGAPYFSLDGAYVRTDFADNRGWRDPGNLVRVSVTSDQPGLAVRPEDADCPTCSDLLVRPTGSADGVDVDSTAEALSSALAAGLLTESAHWVKLTDLRPLHASGLMERVESQLTCTTCRRIICFTLFRDTSPTFGYHVLGEARRRPMELVPPVEQWGDATRIAEADSAMHYVDHEPGSWFLVEQQGVLHLDARYSYSAIIDDSALIRLDESETDSYRARGHDYVSGLARRIRDSAPYSQESPYRDRDLYRGPDGKAYRAAVTSAVANHTWLAEQRSSGQ